MEGQAEAAGEPCCVSSDLKGGCGCTGCLAVASSQDVDENIKILRRGSSRIDAAQRVDGELACGQGGTLRDSSEGRVI